MLQLLSCGYYRLQGGVGEASIMYLIFLLHPRYNLSLNSMADGPTSDITPNSWSRIGHNAREFALHSDSHHLSWVHMEQLLGAIISSFPVSRKIAARSIAFLPTRRGMQLRFTPAWFTFMMHLLSFPYCVFSCCRVLGYFQGMERVPH